MHGGMFVLNTYDWIVECQMIHVQGIIDTYHLTWLVPRIYNVLVSDSEETLITLSVPEKIRWQDGS